MFHAGGFLRIEVKKQSSKMALNAFLLEKKVVIAERWHQQQEGSFWEKAGGEILDKIGAERRKTKEVCPEGEQGKSIHRIDRI